MINWLRNKLSDPLWVVIIFPLIITVLGALLSFFFGLWQGIGFYGGLQLVWKFLVGNTALNNGLIVIVLLVISWVLLKVLLQSMPPRKVVISLLIVFGLFFLILLLKGGSSLKSDPELENCQKAVQNVLIEINKKKVGISDELTIKAINAYEEKLKTINIEQLCGNDSLRAIILDDVKQVYSRLPKN